MSMNIILGQIVHCSAPYTLQVISDGFIIVNTDGKILAIGDAPELVSTKKSLNISEEDVIVLDKTQLLLPGLVDAHIHAPQYPNVGLGYDKPLLEWLDTYTYELERRYRDHDLCKRVFSAVVRKTLDHGTTTACYFGSLFRESTLILVEAVREHHQRALIGKINMTRLAPEDYLETSEESVISTLEFIDAVQSLRDPLIQPVITPRFALSVDMDLMKKLGTLAKEKGLHIQTHISENKDEVVMIEELYCDSYANVYLQAGLLTSKTVLAHGIYLTDAELETIKNTGTSIAHCPDSNTCLKSGLCDVARLRNYGINVGLGTDVSGGPSPSIISAMKSAITVSNHISFDRENYTPLNYSDVFYLATLGGAKALALDDQIGNFTVGKSFDAIIVDLNVEKSNVDYLSGDITCEELLQKFIFVGDDRNVVQVFVDGKRVK